MHNDVMLALRNHRYRQAFQRYARASGQTLCLVDHDEDVCSYCRAVV